MAPDRRRDQPVRRTGWQPPLALLGGGAGLVPLVSVTQLVPGPDPREHRDSPLEHGDLTGQAFLMLILAATTAAPAVAVVAVAGAPGSASARSRASSPHSCSVARRRSVCAIAARNCCS